MRTPLLLLLLLPVITGCARDEPRTYVLTAAQQLALAYPERVAVADTLWFAAAVIARGDSIYHGRLRRGTCFSCHGDDARGGPIAKDLTDNGWEYADGSFAGIRDIIISGVTAHEPPMPPLGGAQLADADVVAVAAYVFWLANRHGSPLRRVTGDEATE